MNTKMSQQTLMADANVRKLQRLETFATDEPDYSVPNVDFSVALEKKEPTLACVESWFVEKGYGFGKIGSETIFIHASAVRAGESLMVNEQAVVRIMRFCPG